MKKRIVLLSLFLVVLLSSCKAIFDEGKGYQELTIINNTNLHIKYSIINGTTGATSSKAFYSQQNNYLVDYAGIVIKQQLLSPSGKQSEGYMLDRTTFRLNEDDYYLTIFVCKSNNYTGKEDEYINKYTFSCSGDKTITIASNGSIY